MSNTAKNKFHRVDHNSLMWKFYLVYDIFMMIIIIVNIVCITANAVLMSHFAMWLSSILHLSPQLHFYQTELNPWVVLTETWFICFLIIELVIRWIIAATRNHYQRWFFFPFIHWYEVLAIFPQLRFLRLLRVGLIAYRLHELGYKVIPTSWHKTGRFYYDVLMEELSDRVVITVIDGIRDELNTSSTYKSSIHHVVEQHKALFAQTFSEILQDTLAKELQVQRHEIAKSIGVIVEDSVANTPEIHQLLKHFPIVGNRIESQLQSIGKRLGENITQGIITPLASGSVQQPNATYRLISHKISEIDINNQSLEKLVESAVHESLKSIRKQVKVKQWQQILKMNDKNNSL